MVRESYFDLTKNKDLSNLSIIRQNNFDWECFLVDGDGKKYDGFKLAQSPEGNVITVCDIFLKKPEVGKKYRTELVFRKTDKDFKDRNVNRGVDCVRIPFDSGQSGYLEFWNMILFLKEWLSKVTNDEFNDYFSITDKSLSNFLPAIANIKNRDKVLEALEKISEEDLSNISDLVNVTKIREVVEIWENQKLNYSEEFWQNLFKTKTWILSQIFATPFIQIGNKFYCGGKEDDDKGGVKGDFLYESLTNNVAFIEIKTPKKDILIGGKYRGEEDGKENIVFSINQEVTGGVNQLLNQRKVYLKNYCEKNGRLFNNPKCILIIGILPINSDEKKSFELYRNSLRDVEIITFDELFERVNLILNIFDKK